MNFRGCWFAGMLGLACISQSSEADPGNEGGNQEGLSGTGDVRPGAYVQSAWQTGFRPRPPDVSHFVLKVDETHLESSSPRRGLSPSVPTLLALLEATLDTRDHLLRLQGLWQPRGGGIRSKRPTPCHKLLPPYVGDPAFVERSLGKLMIAHVSQFLATASAQCPNTPVTVSCTSAKEPKHLTKLVCSQN